MRAIRGEIHEIRENSEREIRERESAIQIAAHLMLLRATRFPAITGTSW